MTHPVWHLRKLRSKKIRPKVVQVRMAGASPKTESNTFHHTAAHGSAHVTHIPLTSTHTHTHTHLAQPPLEHSPHYSQFSFGTSSALPRGLLKKDEFVQGLTCSLAPTLSPQSRK